ncbi:MAG: L,D-transpeptidase family protein [Pseudomonadota bacterium]
MSLLRADTTALTLSLTDQQWPMAIGKNGATDARLKREGDGKTPLGRYWLETLYMRTDRIQAPHCTLPTHAMAASDGWCDDPSQSAYNALIKRPYEASHEALMREDVLYDALIVLSHNRWPAVPGYGSAIFLHMAKEDGGTLASTQGCLALRPEDFQTMLTLLPPRAEIEIV